MSRPSKTDRSIDPTYNFIFFQFKRMMNLLKETGEGIKLRKKLTEVELKKQIAEYPQDEWEIKAYYNNTVFKDFDKNFYTILNSSMMISCYALFDTCLRQICDLAQKRIKAELRYSDLHAESEIHAYRKYLLKVIGLELNELNQYWKEINDYRKVRNMIVHHHSNIINDKTRKIEDQNCYSIVSSNNYLKLNKRSGYFIIKDPEYVYVFCNNAKYFLKGALKELARIKKRRKPILVGRQKPRPLKRIISLSKSPPMHVKS